VDYRAFKKNKLKRIEGISIPNEVNNFGMKLVRVSS